MAGVEPAARAVAILGEVNRRAWRMLEASLEDAAEAEVSWRPHPEGNSIALIVRHLRIEARWHLDSLMRGDPIPSEISPDLQRTIDAVPLDFHRNSGELFELGARFVEVLEEIGVDALEDRTKQAYGASVAAEAPHFLGYHQAMHIMSHCGQIRSIRNLYLKSRGERGRFFPENPTYPQL
jgi:DinB superfamily